MGVLLLAVSEEGVGASHDDILSARSFRSLEAAETSRSLCVYICIQSYSMHIYIYIHTHTPYRHGYFGDPGRARGSSESKGSPGFLSLSLSLSLFQIPALLQDLKGPALIKLSKAVRAMTNDHCSIHSKKIPRKLERPYPNPKHQEPKNAHSHLLAITIGQSETIPVAGPGRGFEWNVFFRKRCLPEAMKTVNLAIM